MYKKIFNKIILIFSIFLAINLFYHAFAQKGFKVEKVDGVVVVSNPNKPIPKNGLKKRIIFKEDLTIGVIEGDENYMFGGFILFNTDDEGNFYVGDYDNKRIQKYDPKGKYLLTIGRGGQGPGEFEFFSMPRFDKGNNLYVYDFGNGRISFFDNSGNFLHQINAPRMPFDLYINSSDFIVGAKTEPLYEADDLRIITKFGLFDKSFEPLLIIYKDEEEEKILKEGSMYINVPHIVFKPSIYYTMDNNDFIYFGYPDEYEIDIYSPEGKLIKKIKRDYKPIEVTKKERDVYFKQMKERDSFNKIPEHLQKKMIKMTTFAKYRPAYKHFTLMENGYLFVIVDYIKNEYALIDLFNKKGIYIAQFKTKVPLRNLFFKNGKAYAVDYEEDFPFVKRYAIELQEYKNSKWIKSNIKLY